MKLAQYQAIERRARSRHSTATERADAERQLATASVTGTVYRPVYFGSGRESLEDAICSLMAQTGHSRKAIKTRIKNATVRLPSGYDAYTDRTVAQAIGQSAIGTGSCQTYRIVEQDIDATGPDISEASGDGWRAIS